MSTAKEPYIISVWEEELIPAQDWYVKGTTISKENYEKISDEEEKKKYRPHSIYENYYIKEESRVSGEEYQKVIDDFTSKYELQGNGSYLIIGTEKTISKSEYLSKLKEIEVRYERYVVMEHFEETQGVIIGSDNMDSVYSVVNPIFKENINGNVELTFSIYYKIFDPDAMDFSMNPFVSMLTNEAKIKLKFRDEWYDLIIKNCVEDSSNYMFTYTCKDFYVNELNKNGFKVELDSELENNQGTVTELGKIILKDTDWEIDTEKSDLIVETKVEPLYVGNLKYNIRIKKVNNYIPDTSMYADEIDNIFPDEWTIQKNTPVLFFYSDITDKKPEPQILAVFEKDAKGNLIYVSPSMESKYVLDVNEDVITNGCNYRVLYYGSNHKIEYADSSFKDNLINIVDLNGLQIYEHARAEKVVRSQKTGYDPDMDRFISKYYKLDDNGDPDTTVEYYGYSKQDILRMDIAENLLANSDNFTSTDTGWVFDGVPEKRSKDKEAGYVGQIFQRTELNEANPNSGKLFEETVLELNLKNKDDSRYFKDTSGQYYYVEQIKVNEDKEEENLMDNKYVEITSDEAKRYEESIFDLYKKYQREGTSGYGDKTDDEIEAMVRELLLSNRYSIGQRVAINTGVAANREKIQQLSPGEEYVFAVSLGKFNEGETPPELILDRDEAETITYGVKSPTEYYEFIEVDDSGKFAYDAAIKAIDEYEADFNKGAMKYFLENTTYAGAYKNKYNESYNQSKEKYKQQYLRKSGFSNDRTKENWQAGGRSKSGWHGLWGEWVGYYEIFLNVLRGFAQGEGESEENYRDPTFIRDLHTALINVKKTVQTDPEVKSIAHAVYKAFISNKTISEDGQAVFHGTYPDAIKRINTEAARRKKEVVFVKKSAYDPMGYNQGMYPDYDTQAHGLVQMTDSFSEFLFSEFYYAVLHKWLTGEGTKVEWTYVDGDRGNLVSLLKSTYKACYENTNSIFESMEHTKGYQMPSAWNAKGGKYYQIHEATWVVKAKADGEAHVKALESDWENYGFFKSPFIGDNAILKEDFIASLCGVREETNDKGETIYTKSDNNLVNYCYEKEQDWLSTKTETQLQQNDIIKELKQKRVDWIEEYIKKENEEWLALGYPESYESYGGLWYCMNVLNKFYIHWEAEKDIGTYTYNTDTYDLNYSSNEDSQGQLNTFKTMSKEKRLYGKVTEEYNLSECEFKTHINLIYTEDEYGDKYITAVTGVNEDGLTTDQKTEVNNLKATLTKLIKEANKQLLDTQIHWEETTYYTNSEGATHYAIIDSTESEENKTGGYVFDRETRQVRLFDPYIDVLNATYIPQKSDDGAYVFDPFTWRYRPYRDWDSNEFRDPLTLEIDEKTGVPGDKIYHPLRLFDGKLGSWYDIPTRYNIVRKYEDPNTTLNDKGELKYRFLSSDVTLIETGHYDGEEYKYEITYPKGYQCDVYVPAKRGKYITQRDANGVINLLERIIDLNNDGQIGVRFVFNNESFGQLFEEAKEKIGNFVDRINSAFRDFFGFENDKLDGTDENHELNEIINAYNDSYKNCNYKEEIDKKDAGLAESNANNNNNFYDEDRTSIKLFEKIVGEGIGLPTLDEVINTSGFLEAIRKGKVTKKTTEVSTVGNPTLTQEYIKYRPYYWRHWGKQRYDYQPKICIQQTIDGIKTYKPYNNIEDKESDAYFVHEIERNENGTATNLPESMENVIYLKNRKTTYRQRIETDYEASKYRMKKVDKMNKNYWIEAPNGEDYLRKYKFGDGETKLFDGHLGRWVQCYSAFKVTSNSGDPTQGEEEGQDEYLDKFYMPYDNIMIPYNQRIFGATKQLTRIPKTYQGNNDDVYVFHNDIYMTLSDYLEQAGFTCPLNYNGLKVSFINNYDYDSSKFAIDVGKNLDKYLDFDLGSGPKGENNPKGFQYIDLTVKENTLTDSLVRERWAYWIAPVTKGFSLTEDPLSRLGMLFETSQGAGAVGSEKTGDIGRYVFLGMQMFKYVPYTTALEKITYTTLPEGTSPEKVLAEALQEVYEEYCGQAVQKFKEDLIRELQPLNDDDRKDKIEAIVDVLNSTQILSNETLTITEVELRTETELVTNASVIKDIDFVISKPIPEADRVPDGPTEKILSEEDETIYLGKVILEVDSTIAGLLVNTFKSKLQDDPQLLAFLNCAPSLLEKNITNLLVYDEQGKADIEMKVIGEAEAEVIPLFPGQAPDAENLHFTNYYIYDPDTVDHPDSAIFEYVGQDYSEKFTPAYDEDCQKIRSIKGKESNYFKLLQDCCDTFDCWMQKDIEHDPTTGQIKYYDKPIYTEIIESDDVNAEPQIFVGEDAKIEGTKTAAKRIYHKLRGKIRIVGTTDETFKEYNTYEKIPEKEMDWDEKENRLLLRLNRINNLKFTIQYMRVPDKRYHFKQFVGEERWNGFKYGVNLKHIKRTIDSNQFSTRIVVKQNNNEFAKDKFCTIARATENPIKENFILDFSYYIHNKLLDNSDLIGDLYTGVNTRLNYYPKLASLNRLRDEAIIKQSSLAVGLDNVTAKYETAVQLRDAALEEITKLTQLLTSSCDSYGQIISIPWQYNKSQEKTQKRQTSTPGTTAVTSDTYGEVTYNFEINVPKITTVTEYPKYNDTVRNYLDQMDVYQREYTNSKKLLEELKPEKERIEAELAELQSYLDEIANKKNELHKLFYHKYSRYIQEGSWVDENYIDDNLYYLDALSVSRTSSKPKVTYDIGVVDVSAAYEYEEDKIVLESQLGDRTYIEDTEFFGYRKDDYTKPYWELVIVTEKTYNITDPSQNEVKVKNYTTQFDDLFQRVAAASQTLQFNEGSYGRASTILNDNGTIKAEVLQESIADSDVILMNSTNEDVKVDKTGITITSTTNRANVVKLVSAGILVSSDGGNHYSTAITGDGINADLLLAGIINTDKLLIGGRTNPNFMWNRLGISSFKTDNDKIDYSSFVRMDQYGIYGIKNYSKDGRAPESMSINDAFEPIRLRDITNNPNAVFGLTWDGFFLNAANGQGKVTIGTGQDFRMSEYSDEQSRWIDRVVIGRLNSEDRYGFQLKNSSDQVVMETDDTGELYLKRKLRISNFGNEMTVQPYGWVVNDVDNPINVNEEIEIQQKDIEGNLVFKSEEVELEDGTQGWVETPIMISKPPELEKDENDKPIIDTETGKKKGTYYCPQIRYDENDKILADENGYILYDMVSSFTSYYYKYETITENKQKIKVKRYYTTNDGILFRTEPTTENWEDGIQNQLDRVTLGIVDTYSRSRNFEKMNVDGVYSSSEYLTKVFSVRSNALLPLEQFNEYDINEIIDTNENFALFDNGNLYARNAWIEGNIRATDGTFKGKVYADEGELNDLSVLGAITVKGPYGTIKSETDGDSAWVINSDGTASFRNVKVSGKIETAIFEHEKVQTVAGTLLITSQIPIKDEGIQLVEDYEPYFKASSKEVQNFIVRLTKNQEELYVKQYMLNNPNSSEEDAIINIKEEVNNSVQSILTTKKYKLENDKYVLDSEGDYYLIDDLKMFKVCLEAPAPQIKINIGIHSRYKDFFECKQEDGRLELISKDNDNYSIYENLSDEEKNKVSEELNYLNANNFAKISLLEKFEISQGIEGLKKYEIRGYGSDYIKILSEEDLSSFNLNYVLFLGIFNNLNETQEEVLGISINASGDSTFYPQDSIAIVDINESGQVPKTLLGLFTSNLFCGTSNSLLIDDIVGQYGLYSDNAYVKGTMVSEDLEGGYIAGITTKNKLLVRPNIKGDGVEQVVFFAGQGLNNSVSDGITTNLKFYVTREGTLYAKEGLFEGIIKTSKIIGNGTDYGLDIIGDPSATDDGIKAIRFSNSDNENNRINFLQFTTQRSFFYEDSNHGCLFSVLHNGQSNYGVGLFGDPQYDPNNLISYKLSFTQSKKEIQMNYMGKPVAQIRSTGVYIDNINDLGENCECVEAINTNHNVIGINFKLKGIS